jgi:hypothetical protein
LQEKESARITAGREARGYLSLNGLILESIVSQLDWFARCRFFRFHRTANPHPTTIIMAPGLKEGVLGDCAVAGAMTGFDGITIGL